eukprot:EG_transcript_10619
MLASLPSDVLECISDMLQTSLLSCVCRRLWAVLQHRHVCVPAITVRNEAAVFGRLEGGGAPAQSLVLRFVDKALEGRLAERVWALPAVDRLQLLRRLTLHLPGLPVDGALADACGGLRRMAMLEVLSLDLSFNRLGLAGLRALLAVRAAPRLRALHLSLAHNLHCSGYPSEGSISAEELAETLAELRHMTSLNVLVINLVDNDLGHRGAAALAELKSAPALHTLGLDLQWNNIGDRGAAALAELRQSPSLRRVTLDLRDNYVHQRGREALQQLTCSPTIRSLSLRL